MRKDKFTEYIKTFGIRALFNELGWDRFSASIPVDVQGIVYTLRGIAEKRNYPVFECTSPDGSLPLSNVRKQIENQITRLHVEHLIIYSDVGMTQQVWQLPLREENKPKRTVEARWRTGQDVEGLYQRFRNIFFTLSEEEELTLIDVKERLTGNFAVNNETVTKKFYAEFKKQHTSFLEFIQGIEDHIGNKENAQKQWYASLMLNRLMFCYFIQKKGFLDQNINYLQTKLQECKKVKGNTNFYGFYRSFLMELFHDGLAKPEERRKKQIPVVDFGKIPYLNGGLFDIHELERQYTEIEISDTAFENIFNFFDRWNWHLDTRIEASGRDINPDVIGYIFEKYINDRSAMGAYYTKEDITEYIGKNTIIPYLLDEVSRVYNTPFKDDGAFWAFIRQSGDHYIYDAVKYGAEGAVSIHDAGIPPEIAAGLDTEMPGLLERRKGWNTSTSGDKGLPTEIWRETIARWERYFDLRSKIEQGEIRKINDLITYNLNIRQILEDFLYQTDDFMLVRRMYEVLCKITVLDPTCGSGAFLFAAMNILEPLYEVCIHRMEEIVAEDSAKHTFFENELAKIGSHPNLKYFIYKNIILNNLYGVDIMKEAVEIAKLRLFLKLVAEVDVSPRKANYGLEPLPDIDFNIRAGNTLVGFATEEQLYHVIKEREGLFYQDKMDELKEECDLTARAFKRFQNAQLIENMGEDEHHEAKNELRKRLNQLNDKLNKYQAHTYGIDAELKPLDFVNWRNSYQPFHWFSEFYNIISGNGGFDVIIGNPPYVVYTTNSFGYKIIDYKTLSCANLYAYCVERSYQIIGNNGRFGMIIPNSSISADKLQPLQSLITTNRISWISNYSWRPSKLFEGADMLLAIIMTTNNKEKTVWTSPYYKWYRDYRKQLFNNVSYTDSSLLIMKGTIPKIPSDKFTHILDKMKCCSMNQVSTNLFNTNLNIHKFFYFRAVQYWVKILDLEPIYLDNGVQIVTGEMKPVYVSSEEQKFTLVSLLSSSLYFIYYITWASCQVMNSRDFNIPFAYELIDGKILKKLSSLGEELQFDYQHNSRIVNRNYSKKGRNFTMEKQHFFIKKSKPIIDEIDKVLAKHYGFTDEELDFIINYDIKYRMGKLLNPDVPDAEDEEE